MSPWLEFLNLGVKRRWLTLKSDANNSVTFLVPSTKNEFSSLRNFFCCKDLINLTVFLLGIRVSDIVIKAKYIHFLIFLLFSTACSLTKGLEGNEYLVYKVETKGIENSNGEAIRDLIVQKPNTRIPFTNFSVGVFIYNLGLLTYDSVRLAQRQEKFEEEKQLLEISLNENPDQRKLEKRYAKVNSQLETLKKKLDYGNWFMRTGNPVILYDSSKTIESQNQIYSYLANQGFFDASVSTD